MPKRKSSPCRSGNPRSQITLSSLDAALDMLATDTFTRLDSLISKFEIAANIQVDPSQAKARWEEAVKRYWVMRSMEVLTCGGMTGGVNGKGKGRDMGNGQEDGEMKLDGAEESESRMKAALQSRKEKLQENPRFRLIVPDGRDDDGRIRPKPHMGPVPMYGLCADEEQQWRRWTPKVGDQVLVDLPDDGVWPGKVIDKKVFYHGRSTPKGYHYFPVRIYNENIEPCVTVKSRLLPLHIRPCPPLLASQSLQSAYNHAAHPDSFDSLAHAREQNAAHCRSHPGVGGDPAEIKREKERWNEQVNWVMNERRAEKVRALAEERERRLAIIAVQDKQERKGMDEQDDGIQDGDCWEELAGMNGGKIGKKKRKTSIPLPDNPNDRAQSPLPTSSIFGPLSNSTPSLLNTPRRTSSPALVGGLIRPGLGLVTRPLSPRRLEKRRSVYSGVGEHSPGRGRGSTWTPPRILPSGDETAPIPFPRLLPSDNRHSLSDGMEPESSVPSGKFDFVSPLGPVKEGRLSAASGLTMTKKDNHTGSMQRSGSFSGVQERELDPVKEEDGSEEDGWTIVGGKKGRKGTNGTRAGSAPCGETKKGEERVNAMEEDVEL